MCSICLNESSIPIAISVQGTPILQMKFTKILILDGIYKPLTRIINPKNKPIKAGFFSCFKNNLLLPKFLLLAKSSAITDTATFIKSKAIIVSMGTKSLS